MEYLKEFNVYNFPFHSGAKEWADEFREKGMMDKLQAYIEECFFEGHPTATDINDLVWFDDDLHRLVEDDADEEAEG